MDCKRLKEVIFLFIDNELDDDQVPRLQAHLARCGECSRRVEHVRKFLIVVRERCVRCGAPESLRVRILTSLPHRRDFSERS